MPNIEYLISSEFHVDKGPCITHLYPSQPPGFSELPFLPELMIPDQIHKRDEDYTLFLLHRNFITGKYEYKFDPRSSEREPYFVYTLAINVANTAAKRGSTIKALSICTKLPYFKHFKPLLILGLDVFFSKNNVKVLKELFYAVNCKNFKVTENEPSVVKKLLLTSILDLPLNDKLFTDESFRNKVLGIKLEAMDLFIRRDLSFNSIISFNNMKIPIKLPIVMLPDTIGDYLNPTDLNFKANLVKLLNATLATNYHNKELTIYGLATPPLVVLINAILTGKRILFLSYLNSAGYIIDQILLALKLCTGGGILTGLLTNYNVFPIIDVSKTDLLETCDSYIAGTINPCFKTNDKLWDLLIDLDENKFHISPQLQEPESFRHSIIGEDAMFISNLQLSLFNCKDDLATLQLIIRRHINEIVRILISSKNYHANTHEQGRATLLMDGVGYYWHSDTTKLLEIMCYQSVAAKFQDLLYRGKFEYSLALSRQANGLNFMLDLHHHMQKLDNVSVTSNESIDEKLTWKNILRYMKSEKSIEAFLLMTYLIPPKIYSSVQSISQNGRGLTIFDKNKGIELLFINLFNSDNQVKSNILSIIKKLRANFFCGWYLEHFLRANAMYKLALKDLCFREADIGNGYHEPLNNI